MKLRDLQDGQEVIVRVNPDVYSILRDDEDGMFSEVEETLSIHLVLKPDENLHHEQFDVVRI
jgi:flagellar biosynthesis/type III secretory pathway protein FliH